MKSNPNGEHYMVFARFCVEHLPDSFAARKIVLVCLLKALPRDHAARPKLNQLLHFLRAHDVDQQAFADDGKPQGNGNGNGGGK